MSSPAPTPAATPAIDRRDAVTGAVAGFGAVAGAVLLHTVLPGLFPADPGSSFSRLDDLAVTLSGCLAVAAGGWLAAVGRPAAAFAHGRAAVGVALIPLALVFMLTIPHLLSYFGPGNEDGPAVVLFSTALIAVVFPGLAGLLAAMLTEERQRARSDAG